jgi:hypothetical protein
VDVFDGQDNDLEELQDENQEYEGELQERTDVAESDLEKVSGASARIETDVAVSELARAEEAAQGDIEFLQEHADDTQAAREESERLQQEYEARVRARIGG